MSLSEQTEAIRAVEKAKKEQAPKKPKFEFPKISTQQDTLLDLPVGMLQPPVRPVKHRL